MSINYSIELSISPFESGRVLCLWRRVLTGDRFLPSVLVSILPPVEDRRVYAYAGVGDSRGQPERASLLSAQGTGPNIRRRIRRSCDVAIVFETVGGVSVFTGRFAG